MTLNGLNGHFTLNFHYYEVRTDFKSIIGRLLEYYLLIYCRVCLHTVTRGDVGNEVADRDLQNIWKLQKNCGFS